MAATLDVADTDDNAAAFGKLSALRGPGGFPQVRFVSLVESGTHVLLASEMDGYKTSEHVLAKRVIPNLSAGMLCLADRLSSGYRLWEQSQSTGADLLWRVGKTFELAAHKRLPDGSYLSYLYATTYETRNCYLGGRMTKSPPLQMEIQFWPIDKFVFYARNPRKNDAAVDRMCASIREFGFKVPVLARSDGTVVDGHLRLKSARKLGSWPGSDVTGIPVILCNEWSEAQVKAFRLMVNRSVTWAEWDDELLSLELQELAAADFDLSLTGFDPRELEDLLTLPSDDEQADVAPPLPENPISRPGDLWLCGNRRHQHRILCGDATKTEVVARLLGDRKPFLMITDPPYGIELDTAPV